MSDLYVFNPDAEGRIVHPGLIDELVADGVLKVVDGPVYAYCHDCDGMFPIHDDYDGHDRKGRYRLVEIGEEQG